MKDILGDVKEEHYFWLHDGTILKNLYELEKSLQLMSQETFSHHVNELKNDFHNWVRDVHQDITLAEELLASTTPEQALEAVRKRIQESSILEKTLGSVKKERVTGKAKIEIKKTRNKANKVRERTRTRMVKKDITINTQKQRKNAGHKRTAKVSARDAPIEYRKNITLPDLTLPNQALPRLESRKLFMLGVGISVFVVLLLTVTTGVESVTGAAVAQVENGARTNSMTSMLVIVVLGLILIKVWKEKENKS